MKLFSMVMMVAATFSLTACNLFSGYGQEAGANGKRAKGYKNARGESVWTCERDPLAAVEGDKYLENNGLPVEIKGNFICENGKAELPKDCQGREFRSEAELRVFWEKHQLPVGLVYFDCGGGQPKVRSFSTELWKSKEKRMPTCKDERGRKRPCI